jgi:hypothetical protein
MHTLELGTVHPTTFSFFVDWCHALIDEKFGIENHGEGSGRFTIKPKDGQEIALLQDGAGKCSIESIEALSPALLNIVDEAKGKSIHREYGLVRWYETELFSRDGMDPSFGIHMCRLLGHACTYTGSFRLGEDVLAECSVDDVKKLPGFSKQTIKIKFRSPGPGYGPQATRLARMTANMIRAVLSFCTAKALEGGVFVRPYKDPKAKPGGGVKLEIKELCRRDIPVWSRIFQSIPAPENIELPARMINALTAYEHAQHQETDGAAVLFYIASIEALTIPNNPFANDRVRSRFKALLRHLVEPKLVETLEHKNFAEAFAGTKLPTNPNQLTEHLYGMRSKLVHSGALGLERDLVRLGSMGPPMRVALVAEIAEMAILEFLRAPFSSLIGHPQFDDVWQLDLTKKQRGVLQAAAQARGLQVREYIYQALQLPPEE